MEYWDLYDKHRIRTGTTIRRGDPVPSGFFHLVVVIWIKNSAGDFLIQKRNKPIDGRDDMWAATGGGVIAGESSRRAAGRETAEELGVAVTEESLKLIHRTCRHDYLEDVWFARMDCEAVDFHPDPIEVQRVKWASREEISAMVRKGEFVDYGNEYFAEVFGR